MAKFPHIQIQSVSTDSMTVRYGLASYEKGVVLEATDGTHAFSTCTTEYNATGRLRLDGLCPDTQYTLTVSLAGNILARLEARTLPDWGEPLLHLAIVGDPHLVLDRPNRNGRLHEESRALLKETFDDIEQQGCSLVMMAGDLTDAGLDTELDAAEIVLSRYSGRILMVPGNHDAVEGRILRWKARGFPTTFEEQLNGIQLVGLDTGLGCLSTPENIRIVQSVDPSQPVIMVSHYQIFPDNTIADSDRAVCDANPQDDMVEKIASWKGMAYIGHKNIPAMVAMNSMLHVNIPQPLHYPAGWLEACVFPHGIRHVFHPIFSEALHEYSRLGCARATSKIGLTMDQVREANAPALWNMAYDWEKRQLFTACKIQ